MKRLIAIVAIGLLGWFAQERYRAHDQQQRNVGVEASPRAFASQATALERVPSSNYQCDGRTRCTQMTSCDEATWFLQHCRGVKMDGDGDGTPCEQQWCH